MKLKDVPLGGAFTVENITTLRYVRCVAGGDGGDVCLIRRSSMSWAVAFISEDTNVELDDYETRQNRWMNDHNIHAGSMVRVVRAASSREDGWPDVWSGSMDKMIGKVLEVQRPSPGGLHLGDLYRYPYFVLEPVVHRVQLNDKYEAVIEGDEVVVGCQRFPVAKLRELLALT